MNSCRRDFLVGAGALVGNALAVGTLPAARALAQGANWATAPFATGDGVATSVSAFFGKPIVLNFWATWCVPCRTEMPSLDALQAGMGDAVAVVPVSVDVTMDAVDQFYDQFQLAHLGKYLDHVGALADAFGITSYPTSYLIDSRGVIAGAYARAFDWNSTVARHTVAALARG
jgi:thiol-disulfide isomerase/thioredoxin